MLWRLLERHGGQPGRVVGAPGRLLQLHCQHCGWTDVWQKIENFTEASNPQDANWPTYVGEFSLAVTERQKYLNGGFHTPYVPPDVRDLSFDENADDRVIRKINIRPVSLLVLITTATGTASLMSTSISWEVTSSLRLMHSSMEIRWGLSHVECLFKQSFIIYAVTQNTLISPQNKHEMFRIPGSWLDDVDNEDGGPVRPGVGLHHAVGEGGDPGKPLWEGNLLFLHCWGSVKDQHPETQSSKFTQFIVKILRGPLQSSFKLPWKTNKLSLM